MDEPELIAALCALAQPTRLRMMRLLASTPSGIPAGGIASALGVRQNTLSSHIAVLAKSGLIDGRRHGRNIVYAADRRIARRLGIELLAGLGGVPERRAAKLISG